MMEMIRSAVGSGIHASYVLFDSWFSLPPAILGVVKEKLHVIAMVKKTTKVRYRYEGEMLSVTKIYSRNRKRRGRSKYLLSVEVELCSRDRTESIPARLVYVRKRSNRKEYLVLISTDMDLPEDEIIRIYGKRWDIEVFFKVCKSFLRLTRECRALSYDAMTAWVAIVFTRYMMLTLENRIQKDDRSLGELFFHNCAELSDITKIEALRLLNGDIS
jgi:IS4 transposase